MLFNCMHNHKTAANQNIEEMIETRIWIKMLQN